MKFLLDQNISPKVTRYLRNAGHDVVDTRELKLYDADDDMLWELAINEKRFFITFDLDFSDLRKYPPASESGTLVFRTRRTTSKTVSRLMKTILQKYPEEQLRGKLLIVTENQVRIRKP